MRYKVLFIINGLGLGNSTRCAAVMEELASRGVELHLLSSGNGLNFFKNSPLITSLHEAPAFFYPHADGAISGWRTVLAIPQFLKIARAKRQQVNRVLDTIKPDLVVLDSEYIVGPIRKRGIPFVAINNSEMVVSEYLGSKEKAPSVRSHFWFVEFMDYLFHKYFCKHVLIPTPDRAPSGEEHFQRVGMIVRDSVCKIAEERPPQAKFPLPREVRSCVFMLSGSSLASQIDFSQVDLPYPIDVVGRKGQDIGKVKFHGQLLDNTELLRKADLLVINGGFSAVSEACCLNKPTFVIPIPGHAEQHVNAQLVKRLGYGFVADEATIFPTLQEMYRRNEWIGLEPKQPTSGYRGASECADSIVRILERS